MTIEGLARHWLETDPDPVTRAELQQLLDAGDEGALRARFEAPLEFGTAGLRGPVGAGPARMNRAVVRQAAWALGAFLKEEGLAGRPVIVGFDARPTSHGFAQDTAAVLSGQGLTVQYFEEPCPTPWVAYACRALGAAAGVVVTASHNPAEDNGYKVYDDRGVQIVAPWDVRIRALMDQAPAPNAMALAPERARPIGQELIDAYFAPWSAVPTEGAPLRVAYTPLHGVGLRSIRRALEATGRAELVVVAEQAEPDGFFPTVRFPNPEEPGTLDALLALASRAGCALALANDPDADRLAVCIPEGGVWRRLSGDEVGILLADHLLTAAARAGVQAPVVSSSIVSSPWLDEVAASHGARVARSLTGFKWLCRVPESLGEGERFVFGYEEALGYAADERVRDKDGIGAAVRFVDLARSLRAQGLTIAQRLVSLFERFGLWVSCPMSVRLTGAEGPRQMRGALEQLWRARPPALGGVPIVDFVDYATGAERRPTYLGTQDLLQLELGAANEIASDVDGPEPGAVLGGRILVRPSGTEPKLKLYIHLRGHLGASVADDERGLPALRASLEGRGARIGAELCAALGLPS